MKADKGQFDAVLTRMMEKPPQKSAEIRKRKAADGQEPKPAPNYARRIAAAGIPLYGAPSL